MSSEKEEAVVKCIKCAIPDIARKCGVMNDDVISVIKKLYE